MRSPRIPLTIAAAAAASLVLASCGGGAEDDGATTGTLDFYTNKAAWEPDFDELNATSESGADITLDTTGYSDAAQYDAFIKQSFRTDKSPGLFTWQTGPSLNELVEEDLIAQTTDIWTKAVDEGWVSPDLRDSYTIDGEQYCVPMNIAYWVMYYNKAIFDEQGIAEPTTWAELDAAAAQLADAGITPYYQTSTLFTFQWFQQLVAGTDPELYNGLATGEVKYTDPEIVDIMNTWLDQEEAGWFSDAGSTVDPAVGLKQGDYAMINFGSFFNGSLDGAGMVSGEDYDMFVIPAVNEGLEKTPVAVESGPLCVAENSSQKSLGLAYSEWWMSPEAQTAWSAARGDVAFNPQATVADPMLEELGTTVTGEGYELYDRYYEATPTPILTVALEQFGAFIANPSDPVPFLEAIQAEADDYWADQE
ncbi:carbohydrate ABC transporter substrate-binding protein, CUT1 family [Glycomyces sambucus]|uniref:Carbohydrate ABC transporter substrate-binding protein, CUT1 family n=1 Tax=Glycomyces sambucus TaxID=380244 RepID=A0A1G9FLS4_9ACTN|nr:extracellular solute-binding protein [Glycomyces sambucus]SDK89334.1 carbohydrate ABC transporter substrate-binding protein, CUT1 family [Glycomyces sambucus]